MVDLTTFLSFSKLKKKKKFLIIPCSIHVPDSMMDFNISSLISYFIYLFILVKSYWHQKIYFFRSFAVSLDSSSSSYVLYWSIIFSLWYIHGHCNYLSKHSHSEWVSEWVDDELTSSFAHKKSTRGKSEAASMIYLAHLVSESNK